MEIRVGLFIKICVKYSELSNDTKNNTLFKGNMPFFLHKLSFLSTCASQETGFLTKKWTFGLWKWLKKLDICVSLCIKIYVIYSELSNNTKNNTLFKRNIPFFLHKLTFLRTCPSCQLTFCPKFEKKLKKMNYFEAFRQNDIT